MAKRRTNPVIKHVRLYLWEMQTEAWQTLCTDARALLVEFRVRWNEDNRIFFSVRQMMDCLGIGQRRAERARDELLKRGWIRIMEQGSFTKKVRHATVYALTNEPIHPGEIPPKDFMRWKPEKNSVAAMNTVT